MDLKLVVQRSLPVVAVNTDDLKYRQVMASPPKLRWVVGGAHAAPAAVVGDEMLPMLKHRLPTIRLRRIRIEGLRLARMAMIRLQM